MKLLEQIIENPALSSLIFTTIVSPPIAYFFGRKDRRIRNSKAAKEIENLNLVNLQKTMEINDQLMEALRNRLDNAQQDYEKLRTQMGVMKVKLSACLEEKAKLKQENLEFYRKLNTCELDCKLKK